MKTLQFGKTADKKMNWLEANDYCKSRGKGWRLPTIEELISCIDYSKHNPASKDFKSDYYWTSTTSVVNSDNAWVVHFSYGNVYYLNKTSSNYVRPVRGGQCVVNSKIKKSDIKREAIKMFNDMIDKLKRRQSK